MKKKIVFDLAFWITLKGYELIFYTSVSGFSYGFNTAISRFPAELILFYAGIHYILPAYFRTRDVKRFVFNLFVALLISIIAYRIGRFIFFPSGRIDNDFFKTVFDIPSLFVAPFYFLPIPAVGFLIFTLKRLHEYEVQRKEAEKQKIMAEINLLKSQIQPHFLFNTLNNLYSLAIHSSRQTPDSILRLSKIMEYLLYNSAKELVPLETEMQHIENYVELEKLRYGDRLEISWDVDKSIYKDEIAPLLLFPFIENAFKHGTSRDDEATWISISLKKEGKKLAYTVVNSVPAYEKKTGDNPGGFGLKNLSQRLQLIYANRYELSQTAGDTSYMSVLKLSIL